MGAPTIGASPKHVATRPSLSQEVRGRSSSAAQLAQRATSSFSRAGSVEDEDALRLTLSHAELVRLPVRGRARSYLDSLGVRTFALETWNAMPLLLNAINPGVARAIRSSLPRSGQS